MTGFHLWIAIVIVALILAGIFLYNRRTRRAMLATRNETDKAWTNLDLLLKQRNDELPKLTGICRGYLPQDHPIFQGLMAARAACLKPAGVAEKARANSALEDAVKNLFEATRGSSDLQVNSSFTQLRKRLAEIGKGIEDQKKLFNEQAARYNRLLAHHTFMRRRLKLQPKDTFVDSREAVRPVQLSSADQRKT